MGKEYGEDKVDSFIEHDHKGFIDNMLFDDFDNYKTTDGEGFEKLEDARAHQRKVFFETD